MDKNLTLTLKKILKIWHVLWARSLDGSYQLATASCAKAAASLADVGASRLQQWPELRTMSKALLWQLRLSGKTPLDEMSAEMLQRSVGDSVASALGCTIPFGFLPRPSFDTLRHCIEFVWQCREQAPVWQQPHDAQQPQDTEKFLLRYLRSLITSFEIMLGAGLGEGPAGLMSDRMVDLVRALIQHGHTHVMGVWDLFKGVAASQGTSNEKKQHKLRMERDEDDEEDEGGATAAPAQKVSVQLLGGARLRWQTKVLAAVLLQQVLLKTPNPKHIPDFNVFLNPKLILILTTNLDINPNHSQA